MQDVYPPQVKSIDLGANNVKGPGWNTELVTPPVDDSKPQGFEEIPGPGRTSPFLTVEEAITNQVAFREEPVPEAAGGRRIVCIAGCSNNNRLAANMQEPWVELWSLTDAYKFLTRRIDRWFEMHREGYYEGRVEWMKYAGNTLPTYMLDHTPEFPSSLAYPIKDVANSGRTYFTSSVAYMLALAVHEGFDEIRIVGINLDTRLEYLEQRACVEYWIGQADGRGIEVKIAGNSSLLEGFLYGYAVREKLRTAHIGQYYDEAIRQSAKMDADWRAYKGAKDILTTLMGEFEDDAEIDVHDVQKHYEVVLEKWRERLGDLNEVGGAKQAVEQLLQRFT